MIDGKWKGKGLPVGYDFTALRKKWLGMSADLPDRLQDLTVTGFEFPSVVEGEEEIQETVSP